MNCVKRVRALLQQLLWPSSIWSSLRDTLELFVLVKECVPHPYWILQVAEKVDIVCLYSAGSTTSVTPASEAAVPSDAKYAQQAMKLLTTYLAACSQLALTPAQPALATRATPSCLSPATSSTTGTQHSTAVTHPHDAPDNSAAVGGGLHEQQTPAHASLQAPKDPACRSDGFAATTGRAAVNESPNAETPSSLNKPSGSVQLINDRGNLTAVRGAQCATETSTAAQLSSEHQGMSIIECTEMWTEACCHHILEVWVLHCPSSSLCADACCVSECV